MVAAVNSMLRSVMQLSANNASNDHTAIILIIKLETAGPDNHVAGRLEKTAMKSDRCSIVRNQKQGVRSLLRLTRSSSFDVQ